MPEIRPARTDELPLLQELEIAAGKIFRDAGMPEVAGDEPTWAARRKPDRPLGPNCQAPEIS